LAPPPNKSSGSVRFLTRSEEGEYTGVSDLVVTPINLGWHLGQHLPKGFAVGLAGYIYNQMTADTGPGASLGAFHGQTIALGPCLSFNSKIGTHAIGVNARYYNEVKVHNRFDGQAFFLTLSLGL
jgi:hypothetical protein